MENPLVVFISSMIGELRAERRAVKEALEAIPLTRPWVFEYTPASPDKLQESYLRWARECDIFVLLLAQNISDPVKKEYEIALVLDKPRLIFLKKVERSTAAQEFIEGIDVKWAEFDAAKDLCRKIQEAVVDELIKGYRRYRLSAANVRGLVEFAEQTSTLEMGAYIDGNVTDSMVIMAGGDVPIASSGSIALSGTVPIVGAGGIIHSAEIVIVIQNPSPSDLDKVLEYLRSKK